MSDEKLNEGAIEAAKGEGMEPAPKKKSKKKWAIVGIVVVVLVAVGAGMMVCHESPSFCSTMCHIEGTYVDNYMQEQDKSGIDKYGNAVSNTNAMMAVLHRNTKATAKSEIVCVDCHVPNIMELAHDGMNYVSGNYPIPRNERSASALQTWDKKTAESFCANQTCHVYLLGDNGQLSYAKLADSTSSRAFNPHEQHHEALSLECTDCHKGHRASTVVCTACHEHEAIELPAGWVTFEESQRLLQTGYAHSA